MGGIGDFNILPKYADKLAGALLIASAGDPSRMLAGAERVQAAAR
jgi:hypothetical protein